MIDQRILNKGWCRPTSHSLRAAVPPSTPCLRRRPGDAGIDPSGPGVPRAGEITAWDQFRTVVSRPSSCGVGTDPVGTGTDPIGRNDSRGGEITVRGRFGCRNLLGDCLRRRDYSSGAVRIQGDRSQRVDSQVLQYFGIDLVGCALTVWNSVLHSFNVRLEVLIFPSGLTGVAGT